MSTTRLFLIWVSLIFALSVSQTSCQKEQPFGEASPEQPIAQARQNISAPLLKPLGQPAPPLEPPPAELPEETIEPRGPITLLPSDTMKAVTPPAGFIPPERPQSGSMLDVVETPQRSPDTDLTKAAEPEQPTPVSPQEPAEEPALSESTLQAIPAPAFSVPTSSERVIAETIPFEPQLVSARTNIELILDASGSMAAPFGATTQSKFDLLRESVLDVMHDMIAQQRDYPRNIALRVFGSQTEASLKDCQDTELIMSMGEPNADAITKALSAVTPQGQSPIGLAIAKAAEDFPQDEKVDRMIILVTDGGESCEGDPCEAVRRIEKAEHAPIIHTITFDMAPDEQKTLRCISEESEGQFSPTRNETELRTALDEAINSTIPYNLKLSARASGIPIPFTIVIFRAGTDEVVKRGESLGTKLLSLMPGTYDILIEYAQSAEQRKPSKLLKGVEILATTKLEQTISFDLARLTLNAIGNNGAPVAARYSISKAGTLQEIATSRSDEQAQTLYLTPGNYDVVARLVDGGPEAYSLTEKNVSVQPQVAEELSFTFQKGTLTLKGITTQNEPIPFLFRVFKADTNQLVASGALPAEGGSISLAPGKYQLMVIGEDPLMLASPRTKISGLEITAGEPTALNAMFEMGTVTLNAVDGKGNLLPAEFVLKDPESNAEMARIASPRGEPVTVPVPPGTYNLIASSLKSQLEPKPSVPMSDIVVTADKPTAYTVQFVLGTLRLRGRNAKEQAVKTAFTIYQSGSDQIVTKAPPSMDWMIFDLAPGIYDALATDMSMKGENRPMIWIREVKVDDGKTVSHEAIFTAGKLKIIARGPNNRIITSHFKVFRYGMDRELISGDTGNDWEIFEIEPGKYYLEASYRDDEQSVTLKKWINVEIDENEIVELVLRF